MTFDEWMRKATVPAVPFVAEGRDFDGWDCWGLVMSAYREVKDIAVPDYTYGIENLRQLAVLFKDRERKRWQRVETPEPMAVACIFRRGSVIHAGLVATKRRIIHVENGVETCLQPISDFRVEGYYVPCVS